MQWPCARAAGAAAAGSFVVLVIAAATAAPPTAAVGPALSRPALTVRAPQSAVLLAAAAAGPQLVAVGERGLVVTRSAGAERWQQQPSPTSVTLTAVRFTDEHHGVAVGHGGVVLVTGDGGQTWAIKLNGRQLAQRALDDAKAAGDETRIKDAERLLADGPDKPLLDVLAWDERRLLVVGAYGIALQTQDGGQTWQSWMDRLPNPRGLHLYAVRRDGARLLIAGEQGLLLRSNDDGASFQSLTSPYKGSWFTAEMISATEWVVAGLRGNALRTRDAGATWAPLTSPMPASITAAARAEGGALLLANQAGFVMRLDGDTLQPLNKQPLPPLAGLALDEGKRLWALSLTGPIVVPIAVPIAVPTARP